MGLQPCAEVFDQQALQIVFHGRQGALLFSRRSGQGSGRVAGFSIEDNQKVQKHIDQRKVVQIIVVILEGLDYKAPQAVHMVGLKVFLEVV